MATDNAKGMAEETVNVTIVHDTDGANLTPAYEEGPHLNDPDIRQKKAEQMQAHGWTHEDDHLTDDMKAILKDA